MIPLTKVQIQQFLREDIGEGDVTSASIQSLFSKKCSFKFFSKEKESFILCGSDVLGMILSEIESEGFTVKIFKKDGERVEFNEVILEGEAIVKDFLIAERISLNLMQQLSAVSTKTASIVSALSNKKIKILDTRKTVPGLRILQKYAVKCGGGNNHRFGLFDMIMIKDNHIIAAGGIREAIELAIANNRSLKIEVECENLDQVKEAIKHKIDVIMLDNMNPQKIREACRIIRKTDIKIEISGGVSLRNIKNFANLDVDFISSGSLTHSVRSVDISARIKL